MFIPSELIIIGFDPPPYRNHNEDILVISSLMSFAHWFI
jgi:hypothetical protein